ncbi:GAF domain-containing protein [Rugamonas sp.]|uniref:GAF domain-containing protein n=1 Tax=Rugamonas sp. TaxID=1926287 RepID=UPI0025E730A3|nr:GAF domain-containing protein [Rugamonas sp.]
MQPSATLLIKLQDLSQFLAAGNLDDDLNHQAALTARLLGADTCSIMLINDGGGEDLRMSVCATHGPLPAAAWKATVGRGEGIAGQVLASGVSLLVPDITQSSYAHLARRGGDARRSLMLAPIRMDHKIIGLVNVSCGQAKACFDAEDLHLLDVLTLFIGKSIQVLQLQTILNSRFTQMALMAAMRADGADPVRFQQPEQLARLLAKSFYKEMNRAGFDSSQIVQAASEIITQLHAELHEQQTVSGAAPGDEVLH